MKRGIKRFVFFFLNIKYFFRMIDLIGILQYVKFLVLNYKEGYIIDDNVRVLIVVLRFYEKIGDKFYFDFVYRYMVFLYNVYIEDGFFRNFMNYLRVFLDEKGIEDCFVRFLIVFLYVYSFEIFDSFIKEFVYVMLKCLFRNVLYFIYLISIVYLVIVFLILYDIKEFLSEVKMYLEVFFEKFLNFYYKYLDENWKWFLDKFIYVNVIIFYVLFRVFVVIEKEKYLKVVKEVFDFLFGILFENGFLRVIGNRGWYEKGKECFYFDE